MKDKQKVEGWELDQARRDGYAAAIEDIAKFVANYPGNTYTMDCDHKELAERIKDLSRGSR